MLEPAVVGSELCDSALWVQMQVIVLDVLFGWGNEECGKCRDLSWCPWAVRVPVAALWKTKGWF